MFCCCFVLFAAIDATFVAGLFVWPATLRGLCSSVVLRISQKERSRLPSELRLIAL